MVATLFFYMTIKRSPLTGFCSGVLNTIENADRCLEIAKEKGVRCYSIGKLIHNEDTVRTYEERGLSTIETPGQDSCALALIRAHGISDSLRKDFEKSGYLLTDCTCSNIIKTRKKIQNAVKNGRTVVLAGMAEHAETRGLAGIESCSVLTVSNVSEAENLAVLLPSDCPVTFVCQTTFPASELEAVKSVIAEQFPNAVFEDELCPSCLARKKEALKIADECDVVVVVGSLSSANTGDLAATVANTGKKVFRLENSRGLTPSVCKTLSVYGSIGVCSGTSVSRETVDDVCQILGGLNDFAE